MRRRHRDDDLDVHILGAGALPRKIEGEQEQDGYYDQAYNQEERQAGEAQVMP